MQKLHYVTLFSNPLLVLHYLSSDPGMWAHQQMVLAGGPDSPASLQIVQALFQKEGDIITIQFLILSVKTFKQALYVLVV